MVFIQRAFTLAVPVDEAFALLVDPAVVAASLPGARPTTRGASDGELDLDVGFAMVTVRGRIEPGKRDREAGSISFRGEGIEVESDAEIRAGGSVRLTAADGATEVAVDLEIEGGGLLSAGGSSGVERTMGRLVDAFAAGIRERRAAPVAVSEDPDARAELEAGEDELEAVGYGWMVAAGDDTEGSPPVPADAEIPSTPPPPEPGEAQPRRPPRQVPGRIEVMTSGPVPASGIPIGDSPGARIRALHRSRPWVIPAVLLGVIALALLLRRRSERS